MKTRLILFFLLIGAYAHGQRIFWVERSNNRIMQSSGFSAASPTVFRSGLNAPQHVEVVPEEGYLIFTSNGGESIKRVDLSDGGNEIFLNDNAAFEGYSDIAVNGDEGYVYGTEINGGIEYTDIFTGTTTGFMNLSGVSSGNFMFGIDYSSSVGNIFYVDADDPAIYGAVGPLGNTAFPGFPTGPSYEYLEIDGINNLLYYSDGSQIFRSDTQGSGVAIIQPNAGSSITAMAFYDRVGLFYTTSTQIWFYDIVTSTNTLLRSGLSNVRGLAVELDTSRPTVSSLDPVDGAVGVTNGQTQIRINFNEEVQESITSATGTDVQVRIFREGSLFQAIDRSSITFSGNEAQISTNALLPGDYYVQVGGNVVSNLSRLDFLGISTTTQWNFTVPCNNPTVAPSGGNISNITSSAVDVAWTNGNGNARLLVFKEGSTVDFVPVDLTDYGPGDSDFGMVDLGSSNFLVDNTNGFNTSVGSLSPSTTYFYSIFEFDDATNCYGPAFTGSFTTLCIDPTVQATGMGQSGLLSSSVDLNWTNGDGDSRIVLAEQSSGTNVSQPPVDGTGYTANAAFGSGDDLGGGVFVIYQGTGTAVSVTGLSSNTDYVFTVFEFNSTGGLCYNEGTGGTNSVSLTTLADWTLSTTGTTAALSSLQDTQAEGQANISMELTFTGGGPDLRFTDLVFSQGTGNDVADWTNVLEGAELFNPSEGITEVGTISANNIAFNSLATCGSCFGRAATGETYELYIWLKAPLDIDADGDNLVFEILESNITIGGGGSVLASGASANSGATNNEIQVVATDLQFLQQPTDNNVNTAMTPAVTVEALDANGNLDLDFTQQIDITSTGTLITTPVSVNATAGLATFSGIIHTLSGTNLTLTANSSGQNAATSGQFNIVAIPEPLEHVSSFNVDGVGLTTIDLSWVESVNAQLAEGYLLQARSNAASFPAVVDGTSQVDDTDLTDGVAVVNLTAGTNSYQFTGAIPAVAYTFRIYPYTNSGVDIDYKTDGTVPEQTANTLANTDSDVIASTPFVTPVNIDYLSFLGADATNSSYLLGSFDVRDGGAGNDADLVSTVLTSITFGLTNSANISRIALYDGSTELGEVAGGATASFTGLTVSVPDDGTTTLEVYVTFNTTVTDGQQMQIDVTGVSSASLTSGFAATDGGGASILNAAPIEVLATAITVVQEPSSAADQYVALPQQPIFQAVDVNDNVDIDFNASLIVGTGAPADLQPVSAPASFTSGVADFTGSGFNFEGVGTSTMHVQASGITSSNTIAITVSGTVPSVTAVTPTDDTACVGGNGTVTVTGVTPGVLADYTFELFDDVPASVGSPGPLFENLAAGDYTVVATNNNSGISSAPFAVTVGETLPVIDGTLSSAAPGICLGESVDLSVAITGGGDPYELQIDDGSTVSNFGNYISGNPIPVSPTSTTTYTLVALTDLDGCTGTVSGSVTITVNPIPTLMATPTANTACSPFNGELALTVTGGSGDVTYTITGQESLSPTGTGNDVISDLSPGNYTITVTDNNTNCPSLPIDAFIDNTADLPSVDAGSDTNLCEGTSITLTASPSGGDGNYTFLWDNAGTLDDPTAQSPVASPTSTTTYTVTVTDGLGCESFSSSVIVSVSPLFQSVTLSNNGAATICEGDNATLTATMLGGRGPYSLMLDDGTSLTNYTSGTAITVSPTATTTYTIVSIEDAFSCSVGTISGSVTINVDQAPSAATVGSDDTTCDPTYPSLGGNVPAVGTGLWSTTGSATIDTPTSPTSSVSNLAFGANTFTWSITNGVCTEATTATITITREEPPTGAGAISGSTELCSDAQGVTYTVAGITGATSYAWTLPTGFTATSLTTTDPSITVNLENGRTGEVEVTASNDCGILTATALSVSIIEAAEVTIIVPEELKPGVEIPFSFSSTVGLSATNWNFGDGATSTAANPVHIYAEAGNYSVELAFQNDEGCTGSTRLNVTVVPRETVSIKNAITPNGDGQNDLLTIEGILDYPDNKVTLFDRWGVEVAQFSGYTNDWDLLIGGDYIPAGNYICVVELPEIGETLKRSITVVKGD